MSSIAVRQARPSVASRVAARARSLGRETLLAVGGLAVIGVHALDDQFVRPEPGVEAGDHLVSGLVPLAVLAVAAWIYGRSRAGVRAFDRARYRRLRPGRARSRPCTAFDRGQGASGDELHRLRHACPPACCCSASASSRSGDRGRRDDGHVRRYLPPGADPRASPLVRRSSPSRDAGRRRLPVRPHRPWRRHRRRPRCPRAGRDPADRRRPQPDPASYVPSRNGAADHRLRPGYNQHPRPRADARAPRLRRAALRPARRGPTATAIPTPSAGRPAGPRRRRRLPAVAARRSRGRIGGLGLSVAGETLLQTAAHNDGLRRGRVEGAGNRSVLRGARHAAGRGGYWPSMPTHFVMTGGRWRCSPTSRRPPNLGAWSPPDRAARSCSSRPARALDSEVLNRPSSTPPPASRARALGDPRGRPHRLASRHTRRSTSSASSGSSTTPSSARR